MPHRDPETGQYLSHDDMDQYHSYEYLTYNGYITVQANELPGDTTGRYANAAVFTSGKAVDYDDILDRDEVGEVLHVSHGLQAMPTSTQTADGSMRVSVQLGASPTSSETVVDVDEEGERETGVANRDVFQKAEADDSADPLGRPLIGHSGGPFSDGSSGVGGSNNAASDSYSQPVYGYQVDARDNFFAAGIIEAENIDDTSIIAEYSGQQFIGVHDRC